MNHPAHQPALFDGTWCQRWRSRRPSWRRTSEGGFDPSRYHVTAIADPPARDFVASHHYARTYPAARLRYGLVDNTTGRLVGVAVLGVPMSERVLTGPFPQLRPYRQSLELARLVLLDQVPANAETWFLARAFRLAAAHGIRGVVMFSDPMPRVIHGELILPGHVGTVYQALGGCRYTGRSTARALTVLPDGTVLPARSLQKVRAGEVGARGVIERLQRLGAPPPDPHRWPHPGEWLTHALDQLGARRLRHHGCHRYVIPVGDRGTRRTIAIGLDAQPYPKHPDPAHV